MRSEIDKLDIGKFETTPFDLSKLNHAVKNEATKKTKYNELVKKVIAIQTTDTGNLEIKTGYDTETVEIEKKVHDHDYGKILILKNLIS